MADGTGTISWVNVITAAVIGGVAGFSVWHWLLPTQTWGIACIPGCALLFGVAAAFLAQDFWDWVYTLMR